MIAEADLPVFTIELAAVALDITLGLFLLSKTLRLAPSPPRRYYTGVFLFFLTHSICRTVFLVRGYFIEKSLADVRVSMFDIGTTLGLLSVVLLVMAIETTIFTQSRRLFTITGFFALGVMLIDLFTRVTIAPYRLLLWIHYIATPVLVAFIIAIYLRALLKAAGSIRTNAVVMLVAIVLLSLSELANSTIANQLLGIVAKYLGPALMAAALVVLYYAVVNLSIWKKAEQKETGPGNIGE